MNEVSLWYQPILEALGYAIFHALWQSVLLFFPLQLILLFCKKSNQRYVILYSGFTLLFFVFIATFYTEWNEAIELSQQHLLLAKKNTVTETIRDIQKTSFISSNIGWHSLIGFYRNPHFKQLLPIISIAYISGLLFLGLRMLLALKKIQSVRKQVLPVTLELQERFSALINRLNIQQKVAIFFSEKIQVPLMIGHFKPIVIIPIALINQLDIQQTEAILIHELAHVKRMDYLLNIFQTVMEIILFFNPMTWWFSSIIRKEREHCCDDVTVLYTSQPVKYAQALLQLELNKNQYSQAMAATGSNKKHSLLNRIKRIIEMKTTSKRSPQSMLAALSSFMLIAALFCYYSAVAQEQKKEKTPLEVQKSEQPETTQVTNVTNVQEENESETVVQSEEKEIPNIEETVTEALQQASTAMKQIDWDQIGIAVDKAGAELDKIDSKELEQSMQDASVSLNKTQKELENMDWSVVNNSFQIASDALKAIDWDAMGKNINTSVQSMKFLDKETMDNAMKDVQQAMADAKIETLKARNLTKAKMDSIRIIRKEVARELSAAAKEKTNTLTKERIEILNNARQQRDEALLEANKQRQLIISRRNDIVTVNNSNPEKLLKRLEQQGLINRNEKFKITYKNKELKVNGLVIPSKEYEIYLPKASDASLKISGSKGNLSIQQEQ